MKFDLIISNPPYNRNLDLKILKDVYNLSEKICFVHPINWLYDAKEKYQLYNELKTFLKSSLESVTEFSIQEYFDTWVFSSMGITLINKNTTNPIDVYDFDVHGNSEIYKKIKSKILSYCKEKNNYDKMILRNDENYDYYFGNNWFSPYGVIVGKRILEKHISKNKTYPLNHGFGTYEEAKNFYETSKSKLIRFCLSIYKINQNLCNGELASVPYMPTYERSWTDEEVAAELGLTDEELAWAINWIPDFYPEDPEKYAKYKI